MMKCDKKWQWGGIGTSGKLKISAPAAIIIPNSGAKWH
jgi:hypothetical protein